MTSFTEPDTTGRRFGRSSLTQSAGSDHAEELDDLLDRIELTDDRWLLVSLSAMNSVHMLAMVLKEIVQPAASAPAP